MRLIDADIAQAIADKEKLIELIREGEDNTPCAINPDYDCSGIKCRDCEIVGIADHLLANGVTVQKQGRWIDEPHIWRCDQCLEWLMVEQGTADMNYCPHCGALMESE